MEKLIHVFLDDYTEKGLEIKELKIFCSKPVEINYYFFLDNTFMLFELDRKGDDFEFIRSKILCDLIDSYLGIGITESYDHIKNWVFKKQIPKILY